MTISFPLQPGQYTPNTTVAFQALVDGEIVICEVSDLALQDHFGAQTNRPQDLLAAFERGRQRISEVARQRLTIDASRRCLLVTADF